jgi:hypothetical protein
MVFIRHMGVGAGLARQGAQGIEGGAGDLPALAHMVLPLQGNGPEADTN